MVNEACFPIGKLNESGDAETKASKICAIGSFIYD